ncbi:leucine-rich repeat-containing G-protein coupled receptor 5-like protein, partial [Leptotrombidium deliense]
LYELLFEVKSKFITNEIENFKLKNRNNNDVKKLLLYTPFMPCEDLFDWWSLRCGVWLVFNLLLMGNGCFVIVLLFGRSKLDVPRFLVCNLAIADLFMGIFLAMLAIVDAST